MTSGWYKFGDLESGATMTLHVHNSLPRSRPCPSMDSLDIKSESPSTSMTYEPRCPTMASSRRSCWWMKKWSSKRKDHSSSLFDWIILTFIDTKKDISLRPEELRYSWVFLQCLITLVQCINPCSYPLTLLLHLLWLAQTL